MRDFVATSRSFRDYEDKRGGDPRRVLRLTRIFFLRVRVYTAPRSVSKRAELLTRVNRDRFPTGGDWIDHINREIKMDDETR